MIYIFMLGVPLLLICSFGFYVLGNLFAAGESLAQSSSPVNNPNTSADDDEYSSDLPPPVKGDLFQDRTKIADSLGKVQIGLRIMPS
jgi:hypothetical protein